MSQRRIVIACYVLCIALLQIATGCRSTKNLKEGEYLLRSNTVKLRSDRLITRKGELKSNLESIVLQKPNSYILGIIPFKLWLYNNRYERYQTDTNNFQLTSRTVEKPVIYDSASKIKSITNMKSYLFNQGYFYAKIRDTTTYKRKKAYVTYKIETGDNYLINTIKYDIKDSLIAVLVLRSLNETVLAKGAEFSYGLLDEEQSRIATYMRNFGYYKFDNSNITFELDTLNKGRLHYKETAFEKAINFAALQRDKKRPSLDIKVTVRQNDEPESFKRYAVSKVRVFPDYVGREDFRDSTMIQKQVGKYTFKYHNYYIKENVIMKHMFVEPDKFYSQDDYDQTISKLNELGVFQSIRISFSEDTAKGDNWLNCNVFLSPGRKFDFNTNVEGSTGKVYAVGSAVSLSLRDKNMAKGANLLTMSVSGGIEFYNDTSATQFSDKFKLLTRSIGTNANIDMPKFLTPFRIGSASNRNTPRTNVGVGINMLDRVNYLTLINTSANFTYKWNETRTKRWEFSPAFVNIIRLPKISDLFKQRLETNTFLSNTYRETFIEGENVTFIYNNRDAKNERDYSYLRLGFEEAGLLVKGVNSFVKGIDSAYAQYLKFDFDAQHFFVWQRSSFASRFYGGVGIPYDNSSTLPYIKQYYVGGAYSVRGWRIRTLGPGSYVDTSAKTQANIIDRTGDIKLELNNEYRFDVVQLFSGVLKLKGAVFADVGNIWMARQSNGFPNGEFRLRHLADDLAISTGVGVRIDIASFFVVRLDVGFPVKYPSRTGNGWVINEIFAYKGWASRNLVPQFAIGYPF